MAAELYSENVEHGPDAAGSRATGRGRGRPRDTDVDQRITVAARAIYAERGWSGFNFDVVAKAAGVSKDAIYRRFDTRPRLLAASIDIPAQALEVAPGSDLRVQLVHLVEQTLRWWSGSDGLLLFRLFVEAAHNSELGEVFRSQAVPHTRYYKTVMGAAIDAGSLTAIEDPTVFLDALVGGIVMHILATPPHQKEQMLDHSDAFARDHVDLMLRGAGYRQTSPR